MKNLAKLGNVGTSLRSRAERNLVAICTYRHFVGHHQSARLPREGHELTCVLGREETSRIDEI
jgi:hypothetical protein